MTLIACPDCRESMPYAKLLKHMKKEHRVGGGNKLHAVKTELDGYVFDSGLEAQRYSQLDLLQRAGEIRDLELQPKFVCDVNGVHVTTYTADFRYLDVQNGQIVIEDAKGMRTEAYIVRMKLAQALYGIKIVEVTKEMIG